VVTADDIISATELEAMEEACKTYDVDLSDVSQLGLGWAMGVLRNDPHKLKVACLVAAPVFFSDGDLDGAERAFMEKLSKTYEIPDDVLRQTVETLRKHKLDDALKAIHDEAFGGDVSDPIAETEATSDPHRIKG